MRRLTLCGLIAASMFFGIACEKPAQDATPADTSKAQEPAPTPEATSDAAKPGDNAMSEKEKDIRKLLDITGSGKLGVQVMEGMIGNFKMSNPNVPADFWDEFKKEANPQSLVDLIVPIYDKHFSHEDIKGLITFYEGPLGQKITQTMPQITQESMAVGQKWGMELGMKIQAKLQAQQGAAPAQGGDNAPNEN